MRILQQYEKVPSLSTGSRQKVVLDIARKRGSVKQYRSVARKNVVLPVRSYQKEAESVSQVEQSTHVKTVEQSSGCPRGQRWKVHKFGGTCVSASDRILQAAKLITENGQGSQVVVVSAMGSHPTSKLKVTDLLLNMISKAENSDQAYLLDLAQLQEKHVTTAKELLGEGQELNRFVDGLLNDIQNLKAMLQAISIAKLATEAFSEYVVGHGELWSAQLFAATCRLLGADSEFMDTREILVVTPTSDNTSVDVQYELSNKKLDLWYGVRGKMPDIVVATGFIARTPANQVTTLKRNGSDYSATIIGALFQAQQITIWTDVDGVYSADPRKVPEAVCLEELEYHEAWELSYFGANVLHPRTTLPAMKYNIPIYIRNFFNTDAVGTKIADYESLSSFDELVPITGKFPVKGFATINNVTLINVEGTGMVGVPGVASTIFSCMRDANVNVIMISQASSEHSVCFAVRSADGELAKNALKEKFFEAIQAGRIHMIDKVDDCCVLAAVGSRMQSNKGVSAAMFGALAAAGVNIKAMAQGSSEYNITVLIDQQDSERALRAVHGRFFLSTTPMGVSLIGCGLIGSTLLAQIRQQSQELVSKFNIDIRVLAVCDAEKMVYCEKGVDLEKWEESLKVEGTPTDLDKLGGTLSKHYIPNQVIVDCTASDIPPQHYYTWLRQGIHIVTPNKKLNSGPLDQYLKVRQKQRTSYTHYYYEATVGAGLPVIATLKHLLDTGDEIRRIEGIFSGTLSYIFNTLGVDGKKFSEVVSSAKQQGFTEPDPRDDLGGVDVGRKVVTLARECGLMLELEDIPIQSLVPEPLQNVQNVQQFMEQLAQFDEEIAEKMQQAEDAGECLRYVGVVDVQNSRGLVEMRRYPKSHPFAQLSGSDNIISFITKRYDQQPLIVRGPGAGAEVTAGGVFSDLLNVAAHLGAPS